MIVSREAAFAEDEKGSSLDTGILVLRIGFGLLFLLHGLPKLVAGPEIWSAIGEDLSYLGVAHAYPNAGLLVALLETLGGLCLLTGVLMRAAAGLLLLEMLVAMSVHVARVDGFLLFAHTISNAIVFMALMFAGPGRYSLGRKATSSARGVTIPPAQSLEKDSQAKAA